MPLFMVKFVTRLVYPLNFSLLVALVAVILIVKGRRRSAASLLLFAIAWLWMWSAPAFVDMASGMVEREFPQLPLEDIPPADAIVLLGGGIMETHPTLLYPQIAASGNRILHTARLYKAEKADWIICTGESGAFYENSSTALCATCILLSELGIPETAVLSKVDSLTTREDALLTKAVLDEHGITSIILVTSALHMPRAMTEFEGICPNIYPAPSDYATGQETRGGVFRVLPSSSALEIGTRTFHEVLGLGVERVTRSWRARLSEGA